MGRFKGVVDSISIQLENFSAKEVVGLTLDVQSVLSQDTPKKTSWASNNWIPAIGQPSRETIGSPENPTGSAFSISGASIINYKISQGDVFVSNNVPYIEPLNNGHSVQAPAGFVQLGVVKAVQKSVNRNGKSFTVL